MKKWGTKTGSISTNKTTTTAATEKKTTTWGTKAKNDAAKTTTSGGAFSTTRTTAVGHGTQWTGQRAYSSQRSALNLITSTGIPFTAVTFKEKGTNGHEIENKLQNIIAFGMFDSLTPEQLRYNDYVMNGGINIHEWDNPKNVTTVTSSTTSTTTTGFGKTTTGFGKTSTTNLTKETTPWLAPLTLEEAVIAAIPTTEEKPYGDLEPTKIEVEAPDKEKITYLQRLSHFTARGIGKKQLLHEIATKPNSKPRSATAGLSFTQGVANKSRDGSASSSSPTYTSPQSNPSPDKSLSPMQSQFNSPTPQYLAKQPKLNEQDTQHDYDVVCNIGQSPKPDMSSVTLWSKFGMISFPQTLKDNAKLFNNQENPLFRITDSKILFDYDDEKILDIKNAQGDFILYLSKEKYDSISSNPDFTKEAERVCQAAGLTFSCLIGGERPTLIIKGEISNVKEINFESDSLIIKEPKIL